LREGGNFEDVKGVKMDIGGKVGVKTERECVKTQRDWGVKEKTKKGNKKVLRRGGKKPSPEVVQTWDSTDGHG